MSQQPLHRLHISIRPEILDQVAAVTGGSAAAILRAGLAELAAQIDRGQSNAVSQRVAAELRISHPGVRYGRKAA